MQGASKMRKVGDSPPIKVESSDDPPDISSDIESLAHEAAGRVEASPDDIVGAELHRRASLSKDEKHDKRRENLNGEFEHSAAQSLKGSPAASSANEPVTVTKSGGIEVLVRIAKRQNWRRPVQGEYGPGTLLNPEGKPAKAGDIRAFLEKELQDGDEKAAYAALEADCKKKVLTAMRTTHELMLDLISDHWESLPTSRSTTAETGEASIADQSSSSAAAASSNNNKRKSSADKDKRLSLFMDDAAAPSAAQTPKKVKGEMNADEYLDELDKFLDTPGGASAAGVGNINAEADGVAPIKQEDAVPQSEDTAESRASTKALNKDRMEAQVFLTQQKPIGEPHAVVADPIFLDKLMKQLYFPNFNNSSVKSKTF